MKLNGVGYTIVELLIVVASTGAIAITAIGLIQGRQQKQEFAIAVRDLETKLTDVANDVAKGYFPSSGNNQRCVAENSGIHFEAATTDIQGGSPNCIFAGKALQFNSDNGDPDNDEKYILVLTIASRRTTRKNSQVSSLEDLDNHDLDTLTGASVEDRLNLLYGIRVRWMEHKNTDIGALAFLTGFGHGVTGGGTFSGAPETNLYWIHGVDLRDEVSKLRSNLRKPNEYKAVEADGIEFCLEHGKNGPRAKLTLGRNGRQLTTTTEFNGC